MRRRTVLASAATVTAGGLAGCLAPVLGNPLPRRLSVAGTEAQRFELGAQLLEPVVTVDHTARLRVTWTNTQSQEIGINRTYLPTSRMNETYRTGLILAEPSYDFTGQTWAGCWKLTEMQGPGGAGPDAVLAPDESVTIEYEVWTDPREDGCFPLGEYQFGFFEEGETDARGRPTPRWKLTLAVEER